MMLRIVHEKHERHEIHFFVLFGFFVDIYRV